MTILSVEGEEKSGKSTLALTAPRPHVYFSFDQGLERAINGPAYERFEGLKIVTIPYGLATGQADWKGADICIYILPQPLQLEGVLQKGQLALWEYFMKQLYNALVDPSIRTITVDTMTLARRIKANAYLEELQKENKSRVRLLQIEWGHANDSIRNIYSQCNAVGKHLIAVHHLDDEYVPIQTPQGASTARSGKRILEGLKDTYRYVDVAIRTTEGKPKRGSFSAEFVVCGYNQSLVGTPITDTTWDGITKRISESIGGRISFS